MRDRERVSADAVVAHQQPAAQTLLVRMQPVARGRLRDLPEEGLDVLLHQPAESGQALEALDELTGIDTQRAPADLGDRAHGEGSTRNQWHPDDALVADGRHLDDVAVGERRDQRDHAVDGEVDEGDGLARVEKHRLHREVRGTKMLHQRFPLHVW